MEKIDAIRRDRDMELRIELYDEYAQPADDLSVDTVNLVSKAA